jgi:AcrR family transcriptional regulator
MAGPDTMAQQTRTRTRLARTQRRDQIVDAAAEVLRERDAAVVTFEEIADAAGVSRALLYNYFGDRQGLFEAVERRSLDELVAAIGDAVSGATTPRDEVAASVRAHLEAAARDPAGYRLLAGRLIPPAEMAAHALRTLGPSAAAAGEVPLVSTGLLAAVQAMVLAAVESGTADRPGTAEMITAFVAGALEGLAASRSSS